MKFIIILQQPNWRESRNRVSSFISLPEKRWFDAGTEIPAEREICFFKIPAVNSYYYFTYAQIHKVALLGIFGAILGYDGYQQMQKEDRFPEFYERLQALKVSVIPCVKNGIFLKKVQTFNNSIGSLEQGRNLIVQEQWLEKPEWLIYVLLDCEESEKLAEMLEKSRAFIFLIWEK